MSQQTLNYQPAGPTIRDFHRSEAFVRGIRGPIGSSKSTACVVEILKRAQEQAPGFDGVRKTRWAIIRNSYPELKTTTLKTWGQWCPPIFGKLTYDSPITHHIKAEGLDIEILFLALDRPDDQKKLLSLELTGAWVNEAREIPKAIIDALTGRVGRYPSKNQGGCTWSGIMMDTNPPDDQSWWYGLSEREVPEGWAFFNQPSGRSPQAENLENLPKGYYQRIMAGKDGDWIKVYVDGEYGFVTEGKPVYQMYRDSIHCAPEAFQPLPDIPILVGKDFGLTPAAVLGQKLPDGRWIIFDEFVTENCGLTRFKEGLRKYVAATYPNCVVDMGFGDPAGNARDQDEHTAFDIINADKDESWYTKPAPNNDFSVRQEVVIGCLNRLVDGKPGILISPKCEMIRKGFAGGYHFKMLRTGNGETFHETPAKNKFSHPHDALQYLLLGGGEYTVVLNKNRKKDGSGRPRQWIAQDLDYDIFG